jgi:formylmethanofuran dehydrogenase subunit E-like metal-binding protein
MKKYSTHIITNTGKKKEISVFLDDQTSKALDKANDIRITNAYISTPCGTSRFSGIIFV